MQERLHLQTIDLQGAEFPRQWRMEPLPVKKEPVRQYRDLLHLRQRLAMEHFAPEVLELFPL